MNRNLLEKLACIHCKGDLKLIQSNMLECLNCKEKYPIIKDIPIMLPKAERDNAYDEYYGRIKFDKLPFGYSLDYAHWRKGKINRKIVKHLNKGSVLDNGGGYGYLRESLENKSEYYNMEYSYSILSYDKKSDKKCIGKGELLPFRDNCFDNVVSGDVLEHVQNKNLYLKEVYRVLKPAGRFVLNTPRTKWKESFENSWLWWLPKISSLKSLLLAKRTKKQITIPKGVVDIPSDEKWLKLALKKAGFKVILQTRTDDHPFSFISKFWRWFADKFINDQRFGHCVFFVCEK